MSLDWEQCYTENRTPWDKGRAAPPLEEWLANNPGLMTGRVLVPGSGAGYDVRLLAAHDPAIVPVGLDIAPSAIAMAELVPPTGSETYLLDDLFALGDAHRGSYRWVVEHTCFCAIDPSKRTDYVAAVHSVIEPEGNLLAIFFLDPYDEEHQPGEGPPHGTSLEEIESLFEASGCFEILDRYTPSRAYEGREERELVVRFRKV